MELEESLNTALRTWAPSVSNRVRPVRLPSGELLPALCFIRIGGPDRDRWQGGHTGLCQALFQIDVWGWSYAEVKAVAREVRLGITGHPRQMRLCEDGPKVCGMDLVADQDDFELAGEAYRVIMQVRITFQEET